MFYSARLKLTLYYLVIIMLISISFSVFIYTTLGAEFNRVINIHSLHQQGLWTPPQDKTIFFFRAEEPLPKKVIFPPADPEVLQEAKQRLLHTLMLVNLTILGISGAAGYFLAGKTLQPIADVLHAQQRFITDASHELRTPITVLKSETEVTLRSSKITLAEAKNQLTSNLEEINKLHMLVDSLIKLAAYPQTNNHGLLVKSSLGDIVASAIKQVASLAKQKQIIITNTIKNTYADVEKTTIKELFVILLDNAIKYNPKGTKVAVTAKKHTQYIEITVSDNGIGINNNDLPYIFDRFYRANTSRTKSISEGYGLGLSIAKEIIERHKGELRVTSDMGKGTVFTIKLLQKHA